jgi:hypothetical protein
MKKQNKKSQNNQSLVSEAEVKRRLRQSRAAQNVANQRQKAPKSVRNVVKSQAPREAKNPYFMALVAPEYAKRVGLPDEFSGLTHVAMVITERDLTFDSNGRSAGLITCDPKGLVRITDTVVVKPEENTEGFRDSGAILRSPVNSNFITGLPQAIIDAVTAVTGDTYDLNKSTVAAAGNGVMVGVIDDLCNSLTPVSIQLVVGAYTYPVVGIPATAASACNVVVSTADAVANNVKAFGVYVTAAGAIEVIESTTKKGPIGTCTVTPTNGIYLIAYGVAPAQVSTYYLTAMNFRIGGAVSADYQSLRKHNIGKPSGEEYNIMLSSGLEDARIVGQSAWLQYNGSLTSNGRITCGQLQEPVRADSGNFAPNLDRAELAATPGFYSGPLAKGGYCFWRPHHISDKEFYPVEDPRPRSCPLAFNIEANDANAQNVTLRVATMIEFKTTSQIFGPKPSVVNELYIQDAQARLGGVPSGMENDFHWRTIAALVGKGLTRFGKAAAIMAPVSGEFSPVVGSVSMAASTFGKAFQRIGRIK